MAESNPLELFRTLRETLERYIPTTLPISRRYPELGRAFRERLREQELVKGPYVEALPDFEKGRPLGRLLRARGGFLHDGLGVLPEALLARPLHRHQEEALTRACRDRESLLVATGTGSGKTETFLYPLAHSLLDDPRPEAPGVRCLLIYPMNALANDQLYYRIAPLFGVQLAGAGISFGRFTSQIRANTPRDEEEIRLRENGKLIRALGGDAIPAHWRLTREEMLERPPKILITNYAMLEHLLLLPRNAPLFAQDTLQSIVLDEIHTYGGAQATEVAYLLRKLKNRLGLERPLQVFGTSASLPEGEQADQAILEFASQLFGETVGHVIRGRREPHRRLRESTPDPFSLGVETWVRLGAVLDQLTAGQDDLELDVAGWEEALAEADLTDWLPPLPEGLPLPAALEEVFAANREVRRVSEILDRGGVQDFRQVASEVFRGYPGAQGKAVTDALSAVMHLGMIARGDDNGYPLLPGRYHIAVNSIEGVALRLSGDEKEGWDDLKTLRHHRDESGLYYPLLVCRKCGQPYLEGFEHQGVLHSRRPPMEEGKVTRLVFWLGSPPRTRTVDEDDDQDEEGEQQKYRSWNLNPLDGRLLEQGGVTLYEVETVEDPEERAQYLRTCPACGGRSGATDAEVITRMHPGNEALGTVVVQKVLQALPGRRDRDEPRPMEGRNLLTFSDNRQDAAFFAPYFERTGGDIALRSAIYQVLRDSDEPLDLMLLAEQVHKYWRRGGKQPVMLDARGELRSSFSGMQDILLGRIAAEFCTPGGRRNSLEALGLVRVGYDARKLERLRRDAASWVPERHRDQCEPLTDFLLETIRREKALANLYDLDMTDPFLWGQAYAGRRAFELLRTDPKNISHAWLPQEGTRRHNRRTWYLVEQLGWDWDQARDFLKGFWEALGRTKVLVSLKPGAGLDGRLLRFGPGEERPLYICDSCGLLQTAVVERRCSAFRCRGEVHALSDQERAQMQRHNHYVHSFAEGRAMTARAREHTASLSTELREEVERDFAAGTVNVLSCTTTMEMGVDLGELEAIVNLNVPPGIANYQQRTGRAGRRAQAAPFCVTVARNGQYDQAVFRDFQTYLGSPAPIPFLLLDNPQLFLRHQYGVLLAGFLRHRITRLDCNAPALQDFFGERFGREELRDFLDDLDHWLEGEAGQVALAAAARLADRLPERPRAAALRGPSLARAFRASLEQFAQEVFERWQLYADKIEEAKAGGEDQRALGTRLRWMRLQEQYMGQFLVDQLSQRSLIPTYSFPVHSLTLEVTREIGRQASFHGGDIALNRDASLGISEYAPGGEVIANGRIWRSDGLARYPRMFMPVRHYVACPDCHHVAVGEERDDLPGECPNCGGNALSNARAFVEPRGFVTAYEERHGKDPGSYRRRQRPADEARLLAIPREEQFANTDHPLLRMALLRAVPFDEEQPSGRMFIVNRGAHGHGYHICPLCQHAEPATYETAFKKGKGKFRHREPLNGESCRNADRPWPQDLSHGFDTDVLLLRFGCPLPPTPQDSPNPRLFREGFARTLSEALRFAATEVLQLQPQELRAGFRLTVHFLEVILYDAVAGGAGYCVRLDQEVSAFDLLRRAANRLDCPRDCTGGCRACLCDYSNQRAWDLFDRQSVLDWLQKLTDDATPDPFVQGGATRWEQPSLKGLNERLAGRDRLHLLGLSLEAVEGEDERTRQWLLDWLNNGRRAAIHLLRPLETQPGKMSARQRRTLRHLYPFVADGRLQVGHLEGYDTIQVTALPRLFTDPLPGMSAWFSARPVPALLEELLSEPVYQYRADAGLVECLERIVNQTQWYSPQQLQAGSPIDRWALAAGEPRRLEIYFAPLAGAHVEHLLVRDPYCGAGPKQRAALVALLRFIRDRVTGLERLTVYCREQSHKNSNYEAPAQIGQGLTEALADIHDHPAIKVQPFRTSRSFHDRSLDVTVVDQEGCTVTHRYDLSGGVDRLMDVAAETRIYHYRM